MYCESRPSGEPIWRNARPLLPEVRRLLLLVGIVLIGRIGILLFVFLLCATFRAFGIVQALHRDFFFSDHSAISVFPDTEQEERDRGGGDVELCFSRNSSFRLPPEKLGGEKERQQKPQGQGT